MRKKMPALRKIIHSNIMLMFIINVTFLLLVFLFCDIKYEVSDDFIMDAILSGAYGSTYDEHLLFSNILYGYFLKALYQLIPHISWYFVCQILICFFSLCSVTYIILKKNHRYVGIVLSIVFISFFSDDLYILPQFTKTAAAATCAGGALFLFGLWTQEKYQKLWIFLGSILALIGTMIRFLNIYIALVYLLIMFFKYMIDTLRTTQCFHRIGLYVIACILLITTAFGLKKASHLLWCQNDDYASYLEYNQLRASVTDVSSHGYASIGDQISELGLNESDYYMFSSWNFLDKNYFSEQLISNVSDIKKEYISIMNDSFENIWTQFLERGYHSYIVTIGIFVLLLFLLFLHPRKFPIGILELVVTFFLLLYFFYRGRVVYRVEYSIFISLGISLVTSFQLKEIDKKLKKILIYWSIVFCICKLPLYIPDTSWKTMSSEEYGLYICDIFYNSGSFDVRKYRCCVNKRQPYGQLTAYMEADKDGYYLLDFSTTIQLIYYNYKPWIRLPIGYWNHYSYLGGVTSGYPGNITMWEKHGINPENPYMSLVNDNLYVVDNNYYEIKLDFLRRQYYPTAQKELVGIIDGFYIWKFCK